jgi:hypothetical protein
MKVDVADMAPDEVYDVLNLDTGRWMENLVSADDETGEWVAVDVDHADPDDPSRAARVRGVNRLAISRRVVPT